MLAEVLKNRYLIAGAALFPVAVMLILFASSRGNIRLPWLKSSATMELSSSEAIAKMRESLAQDRRQLGPASNANSRHCVPR